jgi:hypothetical protein
VNGNHSIDENTSGDHQGLRDVARVDGVHVGRRSNNHTILSRLGDWDSLKIETVRYGVDVTSARMSFWFDERWLLVISSQS